MATKKAKKKEPEKAISFNESGFSLVGEYWTKNFKEKNIRDLKKGGITFSITAKKALEKLVLQKNGGINMQYLQKLIFVSINLEKLGFKSHILRSEAYRLILEIRPVEYKGENYVPILCPQKFIPFLRLKLNKPNYLKTGMDAILRMMDKKQLIKSNYFKTAIKKILKSRSEKQNSNYFKIAMRPIQVQVKNYKNSGIIYSNDKKLVIFSLNDEPITINKKGKKIGGRSLKTRDVSRFGDHDFINPKDELIFFFLPQKHLKDNRNSN